MRETIGASFKNSQRIADKTRNVGPRTIRRQRNFHRLAPDTFGFTEALQRLCAGCDR